MVNFRYNSLKTKIKCFLELGASPIKVNEVDSEAPQILLNPPNIQQLIGVRVEPAGVVSWSPPLPNWNPWMGCNIDEGPLSTMSLDDLSNQMLEEQRDMMQNNNHLMVS
jgi:ATP-dependent RNA helicase A